MPSTQTLQAVLARALRCGHKALVEVVEGLAWCRDCGSLYFERSGKWVRPGRAPVIERAAWLNPKKKRAVVKFGDDV